MKSVQVKTRARQFATILGAAKIHEYRISAAGALVWVTVASRRVVGGVPSRVMNRREAAIVKTIENDWDE